MTDYNDKKNTNNIAIYKAHNDSQLNLRRL